MGSFTATSDKTGTVTFKGLADGTYEVNETTVPNGFQQSLKAKFNVIIENGEVKFKGTDVWGLAPKESSDKYQVKNVKNVTQLPLTGAAGHDPLHRGGAARGRCRRYRRTQVAPAHALIRAQSLKQ